MATPQDLDALLVGAVYGELSPDERRALDAHLAAHPADVAALEALTAAQASVRSLGRRSGYLGSGAEPPAAVNSLLVRRAADAAPSPGLWTSMRSWFAGLARSPALAAAAMLVIVAGGAGLYAMRGGKVAEPSAPAMATAGAAEQTPPATSGSAAAGAAFAAAASAAGLNADLADTGLADDLRRRARESVAAEKKAIDLPGKADAAKAPALAKPAATVPTYDPAPMKLKNEEGGDADGAGMAFDGAATSLDEDRRDEVAGNVAAGRSGAGAVVAPPPPPASPPQEAPAAVDKAPAKPTQRPAPAPVQPDAKDRDSVAPTDDAESEVDATTPAQRHARIVALAQAGRCADALVEARLLVREDRAYFTDRVLADARVKTCRVQLGKLVGK